MTNRKKSKILNYKPLSTFLKFFSIILVEEKINTSNIFYETNISSYFNSNIIKFYFYEKNLENSIFEYKTVGNSKVKINKKKKLITISNFISKDFIIRSRNDNYTNVDIKCRTLMFDYLKNEIKNSNSEYFINLKELKNNKPLCIGSETLENKIKFNEYYELLNPKEKIEKEIWYN